jgi:fatty acid-binding protein DegV
MPKSEWFKVKDKLPPDSRDVIFYDSSFASPIMAYYIEEDKAWVRQGYYNNNRIFAALEDAIWRHIPEIPEEFKNDYVPMLQ